MHFEKYALLAKLVQLRIPVQEACGDELVKNTHDQRWENGKEYVVERKRPGFEDDLPGERVLKGILRFRDQRWP